MIFYILYRIGYFLTMRLPVRASYAGAKFLADAHYFLYTKERRAIIENLKVVLKKDDVEKTARDVFRNFAKYLVDFFRFSKIDSEYMKKYIKVDGRDNLDEALKRGKGVIMLSVHIGNWELGGFILPLLGYHMNAVVLTHHNPRINDFFIRQRAISNFKSIEIGPSLRACYNALKGNELLALLGDRDFSGHGVEYEFFGHPVILPKGPSALSYRTGATIVPSFMIRNPDDTFTLHLEKPIFPDTALDEKIASRKILDAYAPVMEGYIRKYPGQWFVFKEFWGKNNEHLRTDTVI